MNTIADELIGIAENERKIYNKGQAKGFEEGHNKGYNLAFNQQMIRYEEMFTNNYQRKSYVGAFAQSDWTGYTFLKPVCPIDSVERMFYAYAGSEFPGNIDLSKLNCPKSATYYRFLFQWINNIVTIPDMGLPAIPYYTNTYANCKNLETIEVIRCSRETVFQNPFMSSPKIKNFTIEGEIGTDFDCSGIPVTPNTMKSIIEHLADYSGTSNAFKYSVLFTSNCWTNLNVFYPIAPGGGWWEDYVESLGWLY